MTSKEALERYYSNLLYGNSGFQTDEEELEGLNAIKQDLERLEALEKENVELRQEVSALEDYSYDVDCEKEFLIKENEKLKKVIEILKEHLYVKELDIDYILEFNSLYSNHLTKQEYELLKEVLDK